MSIENGRWVPGIGDPTVLGWVTVAVYFIVALVCLKAVFNEQSDRKLKTFWLILTFFLIALGINKQLDLHTLFTQIGRNIALEQGWYKDRRTVQAGFIIIIGLTGVTFLTFLIKIYHDTSSSVKIALTGCVILFAFILIRASSFNHIEIFINLEFIGIKLNWLLELSGLVVIGVGAYRYTTHQKIPQ